MWLPKDAVENKGIVCWLLCVLNLCLRWRECFNVCVFEYTYVDVCACLCMSVFEHVFI
jgi:hypothetical protein